MTKPGEEDEKKSSKVWIAGAVIGPIVGLALIGLAAFLLRRRKKNETQSHPGAGGVPPAGYAQQPHSDGPNSPRHYYPAMNQNAAAPGMVPFGVAKHESWAPPHSPSSGTMSPNPYSPHVDQTHPVGGQPTYSPSMSPPPGQVQHAQYEDSAMYKNPSETTQPFQNELEGSYVHPHPEHVSVQPQVK